MADPAQNNPGVMKRIARMLMGEQGSANLDQAGADPQAAVYANYVREAAASGQKPLSRAEWQAQRFQAAQQPQPKPEPEKEPFRFQ
mgnify:CR=1 FL=1